MDPQDKPVDQPQTQNIDNNNPGPSPVPDNSIAQSPPLPQSDSSQPQADSEFAEVSLPSDAEDSDLIEKEWVERAKQIVEHTREDPHEQQRALSQMKADYLKKRYDKDIKVSED